MATIKLVSVLKNATMPPWSPDQGLKEPISAAFWPWFGDVRFVFESYARPETTSSWLPR